MTGAPDLVHHPRHTIVGSESAVAELSRSPVGTRHTFLVARELSTIDEHEEVAIAIRTVPGEFTGPKAGEVGTPIRRIGERNRRLNQEQKLSLIPGARCTALVGQKEKARNRTAMRTQEFLT